jgi:hypothetical protein
MPIACLAFFHVSTGSGLLSFDRIMPILPEVSGRSRRERETYHIFEDPHTLGRTGMHVAQKPSRAVRAYRDECDRERSYALANLFECGTVWRAAFRVGVVC